MDKYEREMADEMDVIEEVLNPTQMSVDKPSITFKGRRRAPARACHKVCDDATSVGANVGAGQAESLPSH